MGKYQDSKKVVRNYFEALENATGDEVENVLKQHMNQIITGKVCIHFVNKKALKM
ncbi:hypothetical protein QQ9_0692 [Clostridioides difficile Y312]|uniref:hypothetical protein n=1 Tax=Clostridioides difficile TaxID=1496 RepID=UPI00038CE883|nr:hypothetical protein [Clostridioides difficile]EQI61367.1 hypothetical protein QQ9_0692 [Clostridioides difficile Y312]